MWAARGKIVQAVKLLARTAISSNFIDDLLGGCLAE